MTEGSSVNPPWTSNTSELFKELAERLDALSPSPELEFQVENSPRPAIAAAARTRQPTAEELHELGIKVKDFGMPGVNPLPPIMPYRRRYVQQPDGEFVYIGGRDVPPGKVIQRQDTEPIRREFPRGGTVIDLSAINSAAGSQESDYSQSQPPLVQCSESQESEGPPTPLVTPHGSLQELRNTSSVPASQLDDSQFATAPEPISYSQLGFSQPPELSSQPATSITSSHNPPASASPRRLKRQVSKITLAEPFSQKSVPIPTSPLSTTSSLTPPPSPKPEPKRSSRSKRTVPVLSPAFQYPQRTAKPKALVVPDLSRRYDFRKRLAPAPEIEKPPKRAKTMKSLPPPPPPPPTRTKSKSSTHSGTRASARPEPQPPPPTITTRARHKRNAGRDLGVQEMTT